MRSEDDDDDNSSISFPAKEMDALIAELDGEPFASWDQNTLIYDSEPIPLPLGDDNGAHQKWLSQTGNSTRRFEVTDAMVRAALESRAVDDEGEFASMVDLLGFSSENLARTAMRAALEAALRVMDQSP